LTIFEKIKQNKYNSKLWISNNYTNNIVYILIKIMFSYIYRY
jgi:hypothetical protein